MRSKNETQLHMKKLRLVFSSKLNPLSSTSMSTAVLLCTKEQAKDEEAAGDHAEITARIEKTHWPVCEDDDRDPSTYT